MPWYRNIWGSEFGCFWLWFGIEEFVKINIYRFILAYAFLFCYEKVNGKSMKEFLKEMLFFGLVCLICYLFR